MAKNISVEEYVRRVNAIPLAVRKASFERLAEHGQKMADTMKRAAPRKTGKLANSITIEKDEFRGRVTIRAGGKATTVPVRNGTHVTFDYAMAQEFGTAEMDSNPFFWPIYRLLKKSMRSAVKRAITKTVKAKFYSGSGGNV